jgi:MFS family permease
MDFKAFSKKYGFHFIAVLVFLIISMVYFKPALQGYSLKQHDVEQFMGMSREITDYKEVEGKTPLWTNSMFGGMPSAQIHVDYPGNFFKATLNKVHTFLNMPIGFLFLYMFCFYIFGLCIGLNKWVNLIGSVAFAFSSYNIIILQAGHITKANAIAFMLPVIGGFIMAYKHSIKWGAIIFGVALAMQLTANHLQITYYSLFLFLGLGIYFLVSAIKNGEIKRFALASVGVGATALIAVMINIGNVKITSDYAKETIRGGNDLTLNADGTPIDKSNKDGLDLDYITNWSYGVGETFTFFSPYVKGGASEAVGTSQFADIAENADVSPEARDFILKYYSYWGDQPFTSGPVYFGIIVMFLAVLALVFLKSKIKWAYFGVALLTIALSWGKNYMGLTEFFAHNVPFYNKFRAVTIILAITSMIFPILAALILNQFIQEREQLKEQKMKFYIASGAFLVVMLGIKFIGLGDGYFSKTDKQQFESLLGSKEEQKASVIRQILAMSDADLAKNGIDKNNAQQLNQIAERQVEMNAKAYDIDALKQVRNDIFNSSMNRSLLFLIIGIGLVALLFATEVDFRIVVIGLGVFIAADLIGVDMNYLNNDENEMGEFKYWQEKTRSLYPQMATSADMQILESEVKGNGSIESAVKKSITKGKELADIQGIDDNIGRKNATEYQEFRALNRNSNYRVLDLTESPFNSTRASYFHKSIGGYHGAKLRKYQNLIERYFAGSINFKVLEMLNTKYIIQQDGTMRENPTALGNAWLVREIKTFNTPDEEIRGLGDLYEIQAKAIAKLVVNGKIMDKATVSGNEKIQLLIQKDTINVHIPAELQRNLNAGMNTNVEAVYVMDVNKKFDFIPKKMLDTDSSKSFLQLMDLKVMYSFEPATDAVMLASEAKKLSSKTFSGLGQVKMVSYHPEKLVYNFESDSKQFVVFSEIYYENDWKAFVDGKEVPILKTNYLLRGVEVPAGKHTVELRYVYPFYKTANTLAAAGSILFILLIALGIWTDRKKKK